MSCNQPKKSCDNGYEPFMLGSSFGVGVDPLSSCSSKTPQSTMLNCLKWDDNNNSSQQCNPGNFGCSTGSTMTFRSRCPPAPLNLGPSDCGEALPQPKAFVSVAGGACEENAGKRVEIPCRMIPSGNDPSCGLQDLDPVTFRVTAPSPTLNCNGNRNPITFTIDPTQIYKPQN